MFCRNLIDLIYSTVLMEYRDIELDTIATPR